MGEIRKMAIPRDFSTGQLQHLLNTYVGFQVAVKGQWILQDFAMTTAEIVAMNVGESVKETRTNLEELVSLGFASKLNENIYFGSRETFRLKGFFADVSAADYLRIRSSCKNHTEVFACFCLLMSTRVGGVGSMSQPWLANYMQTTDRSVRRYMKTLCDLELLYVVARGPESMVKGSQTNLYCHYSDRRLIEAARETAGPGLEPEPQTSKKQPRQVQSSSVKIPGPAVEPDLAYENDDFPTPERLKRMEIVLPRAGTQEDDDEFGLFS